MKMLKEIEHKVADLLMCFPETRESDRVLYAKYVKMNCPELYEIPFCYMIHSESLPKYESIGRARRRLQEKYPELRASERVRKARAEEEEKFRAYAKE